MKKDKLKKINEIRVEEVHDHVDGLHFYRIYFYHEEGKIEISAHSSIKPTLIRYVSKIY